MLEPLPQDGTMLDTLRERWEDATPTHKLVLGAVVSLLVASLMIFSLSSDDGNWRPLFSKMSSAKASQVVEKLEELGQPYRLGGDGTLVLVPPTAVNRLRLELAAAGMMKGEEQGFELFESASLSRSDFSERVTYLRALQGELATTIASVDNVRKARVHLNLSKRPVFLDQQQDTSAAIYVEMAPGTRLNDNQVKGIINLVTNSVETLDASRVTLFDSTGALQVTGGELEEGGSGGGDAADQSEELTKLAQSLIDRILGPGRGIASVRVELDFDVRRVEKESHEPGAEGKGVPIRQEETTELFEGTKPGAAGETEGAVPVEVTTPAGQTPPKYSQSATKVDYAVSKTKEVFEEKPGGVARISASVVVDSNAGLTEEQLKDLAEGVKTAIGIDLQREDRFEIKALPFNREHIELASQEIAEMEKEEQGKQKMLLYVLAGVGGTTVLGLLLGFFLKRKRKRQEIWMDVNVDSPQDELDDMEALEGSLDLLLPAEEPEVEEESMDELLVRALEEVERDPASVARLVESWVEGEHG